MAAAGVIAPAAPGSTTMSDNKNKSRRNVLLFWVHIALTLVILGGFVYSVMHK